MDDNLIEFMDVVRELKNGIKKVIIGKDDVIDSVLVALLSEGHVLIEGLPGTAKTLLAKAVSKKIGGEYRRIQFTPDTLPTDVTGFHMYKLSGGEQFFRKGPIFANVVLADELNRSSPRTQAALLEAMQEKQVTVDGITYPLPQVFLVIATQVPYGLEEGVYPLPITQLDRFMMTVWSGYTDPETELKIIKQVDELEKIDVGEPIGLEKLRQLQDLVKKIHVKEEIARYIVEVINKIRNDPNVLIGASHRGAISLYKAARAYAFLDERDYVIPDDVKKFVHMVLDHRIKLKAEAEVEGLTPREIVEKALKETPVPK